MAEDGCPEQGTCEQRLERRDMGGHTKGGLGRAFREERQLDGCGWSWAGALAAQTEHHG